MPDGTGLDYAEERSAIRRALRVRRIHAPAQAGAAPKRGRLAWLGALTAASAIGVAIALVSQAPRQSGANGAPPNQASVDAASPAHAQPAPALPPTESAAGAPAVVLPQSEPVALGEPEIAPGMLRFAPAGADAAPADTAQGLRIINAVAGNSFGLRAGDVVVDLCDRAGMETAVDISAAIATDTTTCLTLAREGTLSDVSIAPEAIPPPAPSIEQVADNTPATLER